MSRRRIAANIYEYDDYRYAVAQVGPYRKDKRFPKTATRRDMQAWIDRTRADFRQRNRVRRASKGTLTGDVAEFLLHAPNGRTKTDLVGNLAAWLLPLGSRRRSTLTPDDLRAVVRTWTEAGVAASTINHRRGALIKLFDTLDGRGLYNPAREVAKQREPEAEPRAVSMSVLDAIIGTLDPQRGTRRLGVPVEVARGFQNKTRARLLMMLWIGITPAGLARLQPSAIDLERQTIALPARRKGRGASSVVVPLVPDGVEACRDWLRAFAWGRFNQKSLGRSFHLAVTRYVEQEAAAGRSVVLPADLRPYDLRHSFASWLWEETRDPILVQHFLQHADLKTTSRYMRGAVDSRAKAAIEQLTRKRLVTDVVSETVKRKPSLNRSARYRNNK